MILEEYIAYQRLGGIDWILRDVKNGKDVKCHLQIQLGYIIGDTEGHDKLAGRKVDRLTENSKQCRYCDVTLEQCADPFVNVKMTEAIDVRKWRDQSRLAANNNDKEALREAQEELDKLSYRNVMNAFDDVQFVDEIRGIHGATPAEVLHSMNLGPQERCLDSCFMMKRKKKKEKKKKKGANLTKEEAGKSKKRKRDAQDASKEEELVEDNNEESNQGVFSKSMCTWLDGMAKKLNLQLRWQSDKNMPRLSFPHGITNLTKMTGSERTGVLLIMLLVLCIESVEYEFARARQRDPTRTPKSYPKFAEGYLVHALTPERNNNMVEGIFLLLAIEGFLKWTKIPVSYLEKVDNYMKMSMAKIFQAFPRNVGMGHMTGKAHFVLHYLIDLERYGSGSNFNSGPGEKNHKDNIKRPGRNTQRRVDTFPVQCANHYINMLTVGRAWKDHRSWRKDETTTTNKTTSEEMGKVGKNSSVRYGGAYLSIRANSVFYGVGSQGRITKRRNLRKINEQEPPCWRDSELAFGDLVDIVRKKSLLK
jgi:hypothetical protein